MKNLFTLFAAVALTVNVFAQAPQKMSYQAVIRNSSNALVSSTAVGMRISILQTTSTGTAVYVETQTPTTNANGLVSIEIGAGTVVTGTFAGIDWSAGPYFIKTETDPAGGTSYSITGTSQLLSVPYALSAAGISNPTGLVIPKLTSTQIQALPVSPAPYGTIVFNTTTNAFVGYRTRISSLYPQIQNFTVPSTEQVLGVSEEIIQTFTLTNAVTSNFSFQGQFIAQMGRGVISNGTVTLKFYSGTVGSGTLLGTYSTNATTADNSLNFGGISGLILPAGPGYFTVTTDSTASLRVLIANSTTITEQVTMTPNTFTGQLYLNNSIVSGKCLSFNFSYTSQAPTTGWTTFQ